MLHINQPADGRRSAVRKSAVAFITFLAFLGLSPQSFANAVCTKWQPGHYIRIPVYNSGQKMVSTILSRDLRNFKGIEYHFEWGQIEKSKGKYDFSGIDNAVKQVAAKNKYLILMMADRTFHDGCNSNFIPKYVNRAGNPAKPRFCTAAIWQKETMDHRIRVLTQLLNRYKSNPRVVGLQFPETAIAIKHKSTPGFTWDKYKSELIRSYKALSKVAPNMLLLQGFNFPQENQRPGFMSGLRKALNEVGSGGMSWPDTVPTKFWSWDQYEMAKQYSSKLPIAPHVQTSQISPKDTAKIFDLLVNKVGAHMVVWDYFHPNMSNYLEKQVIKTVNQHGGYIKNRKCSF